MTHVPLTPGVCLWASSIYVAQIVTALRHENTPRISGQPEGQATDETIVIRFGGRRRPVLLVDRIGGCESMSKFRISTKHCPILCKARLAPFVEGTYKLETQLLVGAQYNRRCSKSAAV